MQGSVWHLGPSREDAEARSKLCRPCTRAARRNKIHGHKTPLSRRTIQNDARNEHLLISMITLSFLTIERHTHTRARKTLFKTLRLRPFCYPTKKLSSRYPSNYYKKALQEPATTCNVLSRIPGPSMPPVRKRKTLIYPCHATFTLCLAGQTDTASFL